MRKNLFKPFVIFWATVFILIIGAHFLFLDKFPPGLAHDEIEYFLSSKTFSLSGKDLSGYGLPEALFHTETEGKTSIIPIVLESPINYFLPTTPSTVRFYFVLLNLLTGFILFLLVDELFKNKTLALITSAIFLINPWSFYLSRFATESPFALLFVLLGILTIIKSKGFRLFIPFIFFVLAFFSYHGVKILFLPIIFVSIIYRINLSEIKLSRKEGGLFFLFSIIFFLAFVVISKNIPGSILSSRSNEIFFMNSSLIHDITTDQLKQTITTPLSHIYLNKITVTASLFIEKYLTGFSTGNLFLYGDSRLIYAFSYHGLFYLFDIIFIFAGLFSLFTKKKNALVFLLLLLAVSPLASSLNDVADSYIHRSFLILPILTIFIAIGVFEIFDYLKKRISQKIVVTAFLLLFAVSFSNFLYFYFVRYPVSSGEFYAVDERLLSKFILESQKNGDKNIVAGVSSARNSYLEYIFYSKNIDNVKYLITHAKEFNRGEYKIGNVTFIYDCFTKYDPETTYLVRYDKECYKNQTSPKYSIRNPKDNGVFFNVFDSKLCDNYPRVFKNTLLPSDYSIEGMSTQDFCNRWIQHY